jgi:hypothetical protein
MKVIKPLDILSNNRLLYTNALDTISAWNSGTNYVASTLLNRVVVFYNNEYWECLVRNSNSAPAAGNSNWTSLGSSLGELPSTGAVSTWSSVTTYSTGQVVLYNDYYYSSLQNSNLNQIPGVAGSTWWSLITIKNSKAQFDTQVSTSTYGNRFLTATANTPKINSAAIINPTGRRVIVTCKREANTTNNWKIISTSTVVTADLYAEAYNSGDNILVAGGASGTIVYSLDAGQTWILATTPNTTNTIFDICYSYEKGIFVAVGASNTIFAGDPIIWYSTTGITWTAATIPTVADDLYLSTCIYVQGKFITGGKSSIIGTGLWSSSDGITWTRATVSTGSMTEFKKFIYSPVNNTIGAIVAAGTAPWAYSTDVGATWVVPAGNPNITLSDAVYVPSTDHVVSVTTTGVYYNNSVTGATFIQMTTGGLPSGSSPKLTVLPNSSYFKESATTILSADLSGVVVKFTANSGSNAASNVATISPTGSNSIRSILYIPELDSVIMVGSSGKIITSSITYHKSEVLNTVYVGDWYDYFFSDYSVKTEIICENIPNYTNTITTFSIVSDPGSGTNYTNQTLSAGVAIGGNQVILGTTQWGASAGILDYSKKETDEFGTTTFVQRAYSKRMNVNLILPSGDLTRVQKALIDVRATPCLWIGTDDSEYAPLVIYGFYKDFSLEIPYPYYSFCSLQIEGLT